MQKGRLHLTHREVSATAQQKEHLGFVCSGGATLRVIVPGPVSRVTVDGRASAAVGGCALFSGGKAPEEEGRLTLLLLRSLASCRVASIHFLHNGTDMECGSSAEHVALPLPGKVARQVASPHCEQVKQVLGVPQLRQVIPGDSTRG